jgi:hypothetical protein
MLLACGLWPTATSQWPRADRNATAHGTQTSTPDARAHLARNLRAAVIHHWQPPEALDAHAALRARLR